MLGAGLQADRSELLSAVSNYGLLGRALAANFVVVPFGAYAITKILHVDDAVATGLLLMAIAPGVPFVILAGGSAKGGSHALAVTLAVILPVISLLTIPFMAEVLLPESKRVFVPPGQLFSLLTYQFVPLALGAITAAFAPGLSERLRRPIAGFSTLALITLWVVLIPSIIRSLIAIAGSRGVLAAIGIDILSLVAGWILGGDELDERFTMAIGTALRNPGIAMLIATTVFAGTAAAAGVTAYFLVQFAGAAVFGGKGVRRAAEMVAQRI